MNKNLEKARQVKTVMELYEYDHQFLSPEGAAHFVKPFRIEARTHYEKADYPHNPKGLRLNDDMTGLQGATGIASEKLALQIARHLNVDVPDMFGRGSQLRIACTKILEHLKQKASPSQEALITK